MSTAETKALTPVELQEELRKFGGSETFTRHAINRNVVLSEGVIFLADRQVEEKG